MRLSLSIASLLIVVSIACSSYKSAGSQPLTNGNAQAQPSAATNSTSTTNATVQEKTPCTLTLAGSPDINGLRLGMTADEVLALFPGSTDDTEVKADLTRPPSPLGASQLSIKPAKYESKAKFAGVNQVTLSLLDGRVSTLNVSYEGPEYSHVDKFVDKFVEGKNLPAVSQWEAYVGMDNQLKTLKCSEVEIRVFAGGQSGNLNYALIKDLLAEKKLKDRREKARAAGTPSPGQ
jgi:hypothetical protein